MTTLLDILLKVKANLNYDAGLCENVYAYSPDLVYEFYRLYIRRPKYSGCVYAPVPCPDGKSADKLYAKASANRTMYTGEYGALRLELLDWCIEELRK